MSLIECRTLFGQKKSIPAERVSFRPSAYGIIVQADKVLLVNMRSTGKLFLPGGGSEVHERLEEALHREVREETGLEIEIERFVGFKEDFFYYDPLDVAFHGLMFFYLCRPLTLQLAAADQIDDDEVEKPRWVPIDQLRLEDIHSHGEIIFMALQKKDLPG
ncbi:MAG TPA: NUDIX domain-containing protein [Anaerolineae bacterium]|nr:NUDIX domain-containing protein [Anaerolineae bacterium]